MCDALSHTPEAQRRGQKCVARPLHLETYMSQPVFYSTVTLFARLRG